MASDETTTLTAQCLCKAHNFTSTVPTSSLPLQASCCHCDSCRHNSGALYFVDISWPNAQEDLSALKTYVFSPKITIFFCGTCSTPMFNRGPNPGDTPGVMTGALQNAPNLVEYANHMFVSDTLDGGATMWLRKSPYTGEPIKRWTGRTGVSEELPAEWPDAKILPPQGAKASPERTPFRCHCGGVDYVLRAATDYEGTEMEKKLPFFIEPKTFKYLGSTDACNSCRLSFGADLTNWTFAHLSHIEFPDHGAGPGNITGKRLALFPGSVSGLKQAVDATGSDRDPRIGTLSYYQSSPDVERYFCGRCGAFVFYSCHDRADMVDVAVGLLRHPSGARAEGLLHWNFGVASWANDVEGGWREGLMKQARTEQEEWRVERSYAKTAARVMREAAAAAKAATTAT